MANCYSLQIDKVVDLSVLAAVNRKLIVEPGIMMPNTVFVNPTDQKVQMERVNDGQLETAIVDAPSSAVNASVNEATGEAATAIIADSPSNTVPPTIASKPTKTVVPAKSKPKKSGTNVAVKKGKNASIKTLTVDLKSKLKSDIFSADEADNVSTNPASNPASNSASDSASESDSTKTKDLKVANQSFVTFSSGEDEPAVQALEDAMQIDETPIAPTLPNEPAGPKMKAIKVPKTFMENGYLVTEMITEMVPVDENSSSQERQKSDPVAKKPAGRKQGSLLSFFKPK